MTDAQRVLIALLKKSLFNFEVEISDNTDWQEVYDEANFQSVIPLAFDGTAGVKGIPADIYKKFKNHTVAVMLNNDNVIKGQKELTNLLEKNNVKYAILKGTSVARYYPKPELRTLGDVDFLVAKEDFDSTKQLLIDNEYTLTEDEFNHFHCAFSKNGVTFELHFEMSEFPDNEVCRNLRKVLETATTEHTKAAVCFGTEFLSLDTLYQAVSLLLHTERHISKDGIGLRQLIDFGVFVRGNPEFMSENSNVGFLKKYGLYKLSDICNDLFKKYFCDNTVENETADMLFKMALKKGNFGAKRSKEETYVNGSTRISGRNKIIRYYKFFENRASLTWPLAKKHLWLRHFGIIYLPIRHLCKIAFDRQSRISYRRVFSATDEMNDFYNSLNIFKE